MTYVERFGPIPEWIRALRAEGYTNIFELCDPPTIYGTEHLFGDWDGSLLVLGKDFAPAGEVRLLAAQPADRVYRHNDGDGRYRTGLRTNRRLARILYGDGSLIDGRASRNCGTLYGNACFFLKEGNASARLTGWRPGEPVFDGSALVVRHVVDHMPNLRAIVCLGMEALRLASKIWAFPHPSTLSEALNHSFVGPVPVFAAPHPSRGSSQMHCNVWRRIRRESCIGFIGQHSRRFRES